MIITFKTKKLQTSFNQGRQLEAQHGRQRARKILARLEELMAAQTLMDFWPPKSPPSRCHELTEGRRGQEHQLSVDLDHPYRLIFVPNHDPMPLRSDGGLDWAQVTAITIIGVEDTHE